MSSRTKPVLATLVALGAAASGLLHAADQTYPTALGATDDAVIGGGAPTAVTAAQVKIGGGQLATGGNAGIGGLSGGDRLDVFGTTRLRGNTAVTVPAASDGSVSLTVTGTGTIGMGFNATAAANSYGAPAGALYVGGTNGQNLSLTTMGVERMRLDTSGRVGIGTAPVATIGRLQLPQGTTRDQGLALGTDVSLYRYNTGSLAVDTGGGDVTMALQRGAARTYLAATAGGGYLVTDSSVPLTFRTANTDRMVIDGGGNVGIGTASPAAKFDVEGGNAIVAGSGTGGAVHVGSGTDNVSNTNRGLSVQDVDPTANVAMAIGSTTANSMGMVWNGSAKIGSIYTFSNAWPLIYSAAYHQFSTGPVAIGGAPLGGAKLSIVASSAANTALGFADTSAGGLVWSMGPGVGSGSPNAFSLYNSSNSSTLMTVTSSGFVGLGTTAPASMGSGGLPTILQINGSGAAGTIPYGLLELSSSLPKVGNPIGQVDFGVPGVGRTAMITSYCTTASPVAGYLAFQTASNTIPVERMRITENGNVGIGTQAPAAILHVRTAAQGIDGIVAENVTGAVIRLMPNAGGSNYNQMVQAGDTALIYTQGGVDSGTLVIAPHSASATPKGIRITAAGNVGIGVISPTSALAVNGIISAKEIKVVANPADYVFADGYRLRPLAEVEAFITAHKHLPGVPSAKEQEEQGEMVADLMRAHLEKIEELNLYVIQQQKLIEEQRRNYGELLERQKSLEQTVAKLMAGQKKPGSEEEKR